MPCSSFIRPAPAMAGATFFPTEGRSEFRMLGRICRRMFTGVLHARTYVQFYAISAPASIVLSFRAIADRKPPRRRDFRVTRASLGRRDALIVAKAFQVRCDAKRLADLLVMAGLVTQQHAE